MTSRTPLSLVLVSLLLASCGGEETTESPLATYWASTKPAAPQEVFDVREKGKAGADVVVRGRVKDFVDGRAVFNLIDTSLQPCPPDEGCPTPWDYCCNSADTIAANTVTVEAHGDDGRPLRDGFKGVKGLDHLDHVAVTGTLQRDDAGNVTVVLKSLYRE